MEKPIIKFNPKLPKLKSSESQVLKLLIEAAKLVAPIYALQENHKYPGANFYPHEVSKREIEKASKKDPNILSPYTVVENQNGKLITIPYHIKYQQLLKPVAQKLIQAAKLTDSREFSKRLILQANALLEGTYDEAVISWMSMEPYILDINIGPVERYDDKLFFVKTAYQAWVGVMDEDNTKKVNEYKKLIFNARRKALMPSEKVDYYDKVQARVDDLIIFSGLISRTKFVGVNLPNDPALMEKYGSEIAIFKQVNEQRFRKSILPAFNKIFSTSFKKQFSFQELEDGSLYTIVLHELAHTYLRYRNSEKNLNDLFPIIDELAASVMGIKVCGTLLLKDVATPKQLESMMLSFMARSFDLILNKKDDRSIQHYTIGGAIFINYLFESGAVLESQGVSWPNFTKMFFALSELGSILERLLSSGTRADAEAFIKQYSDMKSLQRFK